MHHPRAMYFVGEPSLINVQNIPPTPQPAPPIGEAIKFDFRKNH
jgi:hypothetical protein